MEASENDTNSNRQESVGTSVSMAVCGGWWAGLTTFICISTRAHTSCHAAVRSLALPHTRHDTLLYVLSHFHTDVMLRSCTFSCTSTQTSRYAHVRSLALPHRRHATVRSRALPHTHVPILSVLLHFHTHTSSPEIYTRRGLKLTNCLKHDKMEKGDKMRQRAFDLSKRVGKCKIP